MFNPTATAFRRFTSLEYVPDLGYLDVWINPSTVAYVLPRRRSRGTDQQFLDGTLIYFQQEAGVLAIKEPIDEVVAILTAAD